MAIHFGIPTKCEPINYKQKESPDELSHIKPAARKNCVDSITLFAFEMVAPHPACYPISSAQRSARSLSGA